MLRGATVFDQALNTWDMSRATTMHKLEPIREIQKCKLHGHGLLCPPPGYKGRKTDTYKQDMVLAEWYMVP